MRGTVAVVREQGQVFSVVAVKDSALNPGQRGYDGIESITGGLNYYIHGDNVKLMADYVHTWSDYRQLHPGLGDDQFDEVLLRTRDIQLGPAVTTHPSLFHNMAVHHSLPITLEAT